MNPPMASWAITLINFNAFRINALARVVEDHVTPLLSELHWLQNRYTRVRYKIAVLTFAVH